MRFGVTSPVTRGSDDPERLRDVRAGGRWAANSHCRVSPAAVLDHAAVVRQRIQRESLAFGERTDSQLDSVRWREEHLCSRHWFGNQPAVGAKDRERPGPDREEHVARAGGVENAPTLYLPGGDLEFGLRLAVYETRVPQTAIVALLETPEASDVALAVELEIVGTASTATHAG